MVNFKNNVRNKGSKTNGINIKLDQERDSYWTKYIKHLSYSLHQFRKYDHMKLEGQLDGQKAYSKGMYKWEMIFRSDSNKGIQSSTWACLSFFPTWSCDFDLSCQSSTDSSILPQREKIVFFTTSVPLDSEYDWRTRKQMYTRFCKSPKDGGSSAIKISPREKIDYWVNISIKIFVNH